MSSNFFSQNMSLAKKIQSLQPMHGVTIIQRLEQYHLGKEAFYGGLKLAIQ